MDSIHHIMLPHDYRCVLIHILGPDFRFSLYIGIDRCRCLQLASIIVFYNFATRVLISSVFAIYIRRNALLFFFNIDHLQKRAL